MRQSKVKFWKLLLFPLFVVSFIILIGSISWAALSATDEEDNLFQIGYLETAIDENFVAPGKTNIGKSINKEVKIVNTGSVPQLVRVMVMPEIFKPATSPENYELALPAILGREVVLGNLDTTNWKDGQDGYFYYLDLVEVKQETSALFTTVTLASNLADDYVNSTFQLQIKVEAITENEYRQAWWGSNIAPTSNPLSSIDASIQAALSQ